jgi:ribosome-associated translation inhibitor RaiA
MRQGRALAVADDLREFVHERFRRTDEKLERILAVLVELRTTQAGILQILAALDNRDLRTDQRLDRIEARLELVDPAVPG